MWKPRARRLGVTVAGLVGPLFASACASTRTTSLTTQGGPASYSIECVRIGDCWAEAKRACHGEYHAVEQRESTVAENELPGLNARTQKSADVRNGLSQYGPGIESDQEMTTAEIVVICTGG